MKQLLLIMLLVATITLKAQNNYAHIDSFKNNTWYLSWDTVSSAGYLVQYSTDSLHWQKIQRLNTYTIRNDDTTGYHRLTEPYPPPPNWIWFIPIVLLVILLVIRAKKFKEEIK